MASSGRGAPSGSGGPGLANDDVEQEMERLERDAFEQARRLGPSADALGAIAQVLSEKIVETLAPVAAAWERRVAHVVFLATTSADGGVLTATAIQHEMSDREASALLLVLRKSIDNALAEIAARRLETEHAPN